MELLGSTGLSQSEFKIRFTRDGPAGQELYACPARSLAEGFFI